MSSGKNTEQFYGIFYVNICGALITAKKYDYICCRKKTEIFYANISENICGT